ncbi:DNAI1 [Lepeophtheirus salmonis]|uniref:DNAI1 n=1 Tax=Lepeophtheirus salmonis TaxID=72036 RepID=A0A7R8CXQ9_LEPSM|nr:DNAI1 [Lepeophtheirus salmonis]CAF2917388.1 DNAI1 [Lepeophtheirus salmonis]
MPIPSNKSNALAKLTMATKNNVSGTNWSTFTALRKFNHTKKAVNRISIIYSMRKPEVKKCLEVILLKRHHPTRILQGTMLTASWKGISSLHSWIKTQTMIRPSTKSTKGKGGATGGNVLAVKEDLDEEVVISLNAKDPLAPTDLVRFDYTIGAFIQIKLVEKMIDHLDIESTCVHKSSPEGCHQLKLGGVKCLIEDYDDDDEEDSDEDVQDKKKNQDVQTEPPPRSNFSDTVNQWVIYDAYIAYEKAKEAQEEKEKTKNKEEKGSKTAPALKKLLDLEPSSDPNDKVNKKLFKAAKILERMVNQNTYNDIALDDFYAKDDFGVICIFSLKNPSYPEYLCISDSSVMTVDIHVDHPHMVVTGRADGNVAVYNLQLDNPQHPSYISSAQNGKHRDIVWHVKWAKDNLDGYLNFYSISGDGRVTNWTMVKTALWFTDLLKIPFTRQLENFSEVTKHLRDGGRCIAFNPEDDASFLVGTEEGLVYKCTTEYSSKFLMTYQAHNTPLSTIAWNKYVPSIFLTCAAEWMIKMFEQSSSGYIQCLKLSPNLRKQTKDIRMAFSNKDAKKALELEKKKLESLLAMVKDTSDSIHKAHQIN